MNEQDQKTAEYLQSIGVDYSARLLGETKRDNGWTYDEWRVSFQRIHLDSRLPIRDKAPLETAYYTGTGHRKPSKQNTRTLAPVKPTAASVLYNLILDAQGAEEPFDCWCDNYGYDQDSRKALAIYDECCATRRQLNAFFNTEERATLAAMLEDY